MVKCNRPGSERAVHSAPLFLPRPLATDEEAPYIAPISPLYLPYISPTSPPYLLLRHLLEEEGFARAPSLAPIPAA